MKKVLCVLVVIAMVMMLAGCLPHREAKQSIEMPACMIDKELPCELTVKVKTEYESKGVTKAESIWVELPGGTLLEIGTTEGNYQVIRELAEIVAATAGTAAAVH